MRFLFPSTVAAILALAFLQPAHAAPSWSLYAANTDCLPAPWYGIMTTQGCEATCEAKGLMYAAQGPDGNCKCGGTAVGSCTSSTGFNVYQLGSESGSWSQDAINTDCATTSRWLGVQTPTACQASCSSFFYAIQGPDNNCKCGSTLSSCDSNSGVTVYGRTPATPSWSNYLSNTDCMTTATWLGVMSTSACQSTCAGKGLQYAAQGADGNCKCGGAPTGCYANTGFNVYQLAALSGVSSNWEVDASNTDCATTSGWLGVQSPTACQASCSSFFYAIQGPDNNCKCGSILSSCDSNSGFTVYARQN